MKSMLQKDLYASYVSLLDITLHDGILAIKQGVDSRKFQVCH
jgi:hypothetical protein